MNCYNYCVKQLSNAGYKLKSSGWSSSQIIDGSIYQTYLAMNVGKMKKGYQTEQFTSGVNYLKNALANSTPVMVFTLTSAVRAGTSQPIITSSSSGWVAMPKGSIFRFTTMPPATQKPGLPPTIKYTAAAPFTV